jgi:glycosyltransferase involved in cell wall biosynthesis
MNLSLIITTKNEEHDLPKCLESVKGLADEIILVDDNSTDQTLQIAKNYNAKIFSRTFDNYSNQKNYALGLAQNEWILHLDPDETLTLELKDEIKEIVSAKDQPYNGFYIGYINYFLGKKMNYGGLGTEKHLRLFKKENVAFGLQLVHEGIKVQGQTAVLKNKIVHNSYPNMEEYLEKLNRYTTLAACQMHAQGKKFSFFKLLVFPFQFHKRYTFRLGFLDGTAGLIWAGLSAFYTVVKYAKLWQLERKKNDN